jgi:hypothetical protein
MKKDIDWTGFKENVETYIRKHKGISGKMLKQLFDNYSDNAVKNCAIPLVSKSVCVASIDCKDKINVNECNRKGKCVSKQTVC